MCLRVRLSPSVLESEAESKCAWEWGWVQVCLRVRLSPSVLESEAESKCAWEWGWVQVCLRVRLSPSVLESEAESKCAWEWGWVQGLIYEMEIGGVARRRYEGITQNSFRVWREAFGRVGISLLKVVANRFAAVSSPYTLIDQYYHTLSVDSIIIVSNECPSCDRFLDVSDDHSNSITSNPLPLPPPIWALSAYNLKTSSVTPLFYYWNATRRLRCNFLQIKKKIVVADSEPH